MFDFRRLHPSEAELLDRYDRPKASGTRWPGQADRYAAPPARPERRRNHR